MSSSRLRAVHGETRIFAYGSNMCLERIQARAASARPLAPGFVSGRRLAFEKRGMDGSAKANAAYTGRNPDRIWGAVFALHHSDKLAIDDYEQGYRDISIEVVCRHQRLTAQIYVAQPEVVDPRLQPFCWYHGFVVQGAAQHDLPPEYQRQLRAIPSIPDPDLARAERNWNVIGSQRGQISFSRTGREDR